MGEPEPIFKEVAIKALTELLDIQRSKGEKWRALAYNRAINSLKDFKYRLFVNGSWIRLPYVGDKTVGKINELIETGKIQELEDLKAKFDEQMEVTKVFTKVWGAGLVAAEKWYNAGYRSIDEIPEEEMTGQQKIGVKYYSDFQERIPRIEITKLNEKLKSIFGGMKLIYLICGSYRRQFLDSGDIDILVSYKEEGTKVPMRRIIRRLEKAKIVTDTLSLGDTKFMGVCQPETDYRRIDIELVSREEFPYAVLYFTGSGDFNRKMRLKAKEKGYKLNEHGIFEIKSKKRVNLDAKSEKDIFKFFDMKYLLPQSRK